MSKKQKKDKIHCSTCRIYTNHNIVWDFEKIDQAEEADEIWWKTKYEALQCLGCDTVALRKEDVFSEDPYPKIIIWPKTNWRMIKTKFVNYGSDIPQSIKRIYSETIQAYNSELPTLCASGVRTTIAAVCRDKNIKKSDLKKEIDELKNKGIITNNFANALHENRFLGNDAVHENAIFGDEELKAAIELVENLIETVYGIESKTSILKKRRSKNNTNP